MMQASGDAEVLVSLSQKIHILGDELSIQPGFGCFDQQVRIILR
jgi:hypothetical protein